ncbi:protein jag [Bifidobacterium bombi]|uniref:R3H domain-containing protein n=1 Tax=Bifidobacterium bombi DSM 19703 TaxID=1341695 RepID=A0A086BPE3_9BIFI|nr:R3H domain-containing nucleic acid-binding protein [Bifidobacterium bombi]KFF31807.1 R3H domain-containing protein [Bifidobacterium bombi DSM 19703]
MAHEDDKTIDQLNEEADIAADYLEELLDIVDYEGDIELGVRNDRPNVQIVADDDTDIRHLVGKNGEVVDALQLLTRLAVQQKTGDRSRLLLDVDGFLKKRRKHLQVLALDAIDEVNETGEPVDLDPMNSYERKVIHDLVREEGFKSRSHGEEPHRYVTIYLKSKEASDVDSIEDDDIVADTDERALPEQDPEMLHASSRRRHSIAEDFVKPEGTDIVD